MNSLYAQQTIDYHLMEDNDSLVSVLIISDEEPSFKIRENTIEVIEDIRVPYCLIWLDRYFEISERNSSFKTELYAGLVNFLTMSYILACNPTMLSISGINIDNASSATCLGTLIATLFAGIVGNVPIGCAPGVGLSAYFSYSIVREINYDYNLGLFIICFCGIIVFLLTLFKVTPYIVNKIPTFMKMATIVGMGLFLSLIGLVSSKIIIPSGNSDSLLELGNILDWKIMLFFFNLLLITFLELKKVRGSVIISIFITALLYFIISEDWNIQFIDLPRFKNVTDVINWKNCLAFYNLPITTILSIMSSFILVLILDVGGVIFAITKIGNLPASRSRTRWALFSSSIGTIVASIFGCSPIIVHIESVAGVLVGGRTGLTAVTTALLFGISMIISPLFNSLPLCSTGPITIFIGALMIKQCKDINWDRFDIAVPAFLTIIMMPFTFSISYGLFFGLGSYFILKFFNIDTWKNIILNRRVIKAEDIENISNISSHSDMLLCDSSE